MGRVVIGGVAQEPDNILLPLICPAFRRHGRLSWRTMNPRRKRRRKWRQKRKKLGAQVKLNRPNSDSGWVGGELGSHFLLPCR